MLPTANQPRMRMKLLRKLRLGAALALLSASAGCAEEFAAFLEDTIVVDVVLSNGPGQRVTVPLFESRSIGVTLLRLGGRNIELPSTPDIEVTSSDPSIAEVDNQSPTLENRGDGLGIVYGVVFGVTGRRPGNAIITVRAKGNTDLSFPPAQILVDVVAPTLLVFVTPRTLNLQPRDVAPLTCRVSDASTGVSYPNARVEWSSLQPGVASVAADGTVTAVADGSTLVTCTVAGTSVWQAALVIVATASTAPAPETIAGDYRFDAIKVTDSCINGTFPSSIEADASAQMTQAAGVVTIVLSSTTDASGVYDRSTGNWSGSGEITTQYNGAAAILVQRISGRWFFDRRLTLSGTNAYELYTADRATRLCEASYNASFTKR
jgi:hypothetical protein